MKIIQKLKQQGFSCSYHNLSLGFYFCYDGHLTYDDLPDIELTLKGEAGTGILKLPKEAYAVKGSLFGPDFMVAISGVDVRSTADSEEGEYWIVGD